MRPTLFVIIGLGGLATGARAQPPAPTPPAYAESIQVTATRIPEDVDDVPTSIQVVRGQELRDRGVTDLKGGLALMAGVDIAPGGDGGPASSVPEFWGLKELDAFLLVVDGVPWGGAFNPSLSTLDLGDVERIEVQRGPAPVMYGATSFVGVIQVVRRLPGAKGGQVAFTGGSYGSGGAALSTTIPTWLGVDSSLWGDFDRTGLQDDRTAFKKGHVLWRNRRTSGDSVVRFDFDATWLRQQPASPSPRTGTVLTPLVPIGSNQNPLGALLDEDRYFLNLGYDRTVSFGTWSSTLSYTHSHQGVFRGFLTDVSADDPNAHGFRETIGVNDVYLDTHLTSTRSSRWRAVAGIDYLLGDGKARGGDFDYFVNLDGTNPPAGIELPPAADISVLDRRHFGGLYGQVEWLPAPAWRIEGGARLNVTRESRATSTLDFASGDLTGGEDDRTTVRPGGSLGVTWTAWRRGRDTLRAFANWRNTFKPSAVDFGLDSEPEILKPETANSYEGGIKTELLGHALHLEMAAFLMDFDNLVIAQAIGGLPSLTNAGSTRLKGVELSALWQLVPHLFARGTYSYHDARFRDYLTEFDGVPTQLAGKRLEMSPHDLAALALSWSPEQGVFASAEMNYVGSRFLNKRNTALAADYATLAATVGYRRGRLEVRATGRNLTDRRDPVSESELGDAQYYRLFSRRFDATATVRF
ncbi:MAG TPA: TonB-dependent receptor [Vicinamibacteria bacterium]|nr:TonB-dependent receptor [Vicinamibacteria bacterium]